MIETITPITVDELAEFLRAASFEGQSVVPWGAGSLQHLGRPALDGSLRLCTDELSRIVEYNPADLTITVQAGASLESIQDALRPHGQWLPWNPPAPEYATIGGLLATGVSGPLRLGYGTPRDWVLGMRVALGDGRLVKSGGKVVKNVAGYESHKLHIGALGTLGVIAEVTLKVAPLPEQIEGRVFACSSRAQALSLAERLRQRPLAPASLVVLAGDPLQHHRAGWLLAARFAGVPAAAQRQAQAAEDAAAALGVGLLDIDAAQLDAFWQAIVQFAAGTAVSNQQPQSAGGVLIRAGARPASLGRVLEAIEECAPGGSAQSLGYAGIGLAYTRWRSDGVDDVMAGLDRLRVALAGEEGYAVVEDAPEGLGLDRWGSPPATLPLMRALKAQWDPRGILNRGRYIGGL